MDPSKVFLLRNTLKSCIRGWFEGNGFLEVETPIIVPNPGAEVHLDYFATSYLSHEGKQHTLFLRSSPEIHLKQLLSASMPKVYSLATCFRNGGEMSDWHHPEFTMLEWYHAGVAYEDFIDRTVELLQECLQSFRQRVPDRTKLELPSQAKIWTVAEAFEEIGITLVDGDRDLARQAKQAGVRSVRDDDDFETAFFKILLEKIEPELRKHPLVVLRDYPASQCSLARVEGDVAKRFEVYVHGIELCNAFAELTGRAENRKRLESIAAQRSEAGKPATGEDPFYLRAMESQFPSSCGNALGFDRLLALFLGENSIESTVPFGRNVYQAFDT